MKKLAITAGDPGGIGPEVVLKAVPMVSHECLPLIIGNSAVVEEALSLSGVVLRMREIREAGEAFPSVGTLWCIDPVAGSVFKKGITAAENGVAAVGCIKKGAALAMEKKVDALVTAPISKGALNLAGFPWPGHTEMLGEFTGTREYAMMLVGGPLKVILVTIHTSLRNVPGLITKENVLRTIRLAKKASDMLGIERPRIAVAGLNPHAGESGVLGTEERDEVIPAVEAAVGEGIVAEGPYPPDIIFHKAYHGSVDIVVCMYHDQGLIPLKMIAFEKGVNVTVGLPIIRTSPDHGTAFDIAWKGIANPSSMIEAIRLALRLRLP